MQVNVCGTQQFFLRDLAPPWAHCSKLFLPFPRSPRDIIESCGYSIFPVPMHLYWFCWVNLVTTVSSSRIDRERDVPVTWLLECAGGDCKHVQEGMQDTERKCDIWERSLLLEMRQIECGPPNINITITRYIFRARTSSVQITVLEQHLGASDSFKPLLRATAQGDDHNEKCVQWRSAIKNSPDDVPEGKSTILDAPMCNGGLVSWAQNSWALEPPRR